MGHHQPHERSSMTTIIEFLYARLDEDEATAQAARGATWVASQRDGVVDLDDTHGHQIAGVDGGLAWSDAEFMAHHDPARALREIAAKRFLIGQWADRYSTHHHSVEHAESDAIDVLHALAEIAAKRLLNDQWADRYSTNPHIVGYEESDAIDVLHALATVYADHPDYRQVWTP